jgi:hypothetical protein
MRRFVNLCLLLLIFLCCSSRAGVIKSRPRTPPLHQPRPVWGIEDDPITIRNNRHSWERRLKLRWLRHSLYGHNQEPPLVHQPQIVQ